jgi:hypothetical protein
MIDTSPDAAGPRALVMELTEARAEQRWLQRRMALASTDPERARIRLELEMLAERIARLTERHAAVPTWERR